MFVSIGVLWTLKIRSNGRTRDVVGEDWDFVFKHRLRKVALVDPKTNAIFVRYYQREIRVARVNPRLQLTNN